MGEYYAFFFLNPFCLVEFRSRNDSAMKMSTSTLPKDYQLNYLGKTITNHQQKTHSHDSLNVQLC